MPGSNYEDEIAAAMSAASLNQMHQSVNSLKRGDPRMRYEPYPETSPSEQELLKTVPNASVPLDVAAIVKGILGARGVQ